MADSRPSEPLYVYVVLTDGQKSIRGQKAITIKDCVSSPVASKTLYKSSGGDDNSGGFEIGS
ncbi:MAG: hypothetical protein E7107_01245 [Prevotella sp.]|nr:hypothetical protein [Prevotella sp.]